MKFLKLTSIALLSIMASSLMAQTAPLQPTIMVIPSEVQMNKMGFLKSVDNHGVTEYIPDYRKAFVENTDLRYVISKIGELFSDRGFHLKDLDYELRATQQENAMDIAYESRDGGGVASSLLDQVLNSARPDIILELTYEVKSVGGPMHCLYFDIQAKDAYTREQVAAASGAGPNTTETLTVKMAEEAVLTHIGNLQSQMQNYFNDISANGRKIFARIQVYEDAGVDLEDEFGTDDEELGDLLSQWMKKNSVNHASRVTKNTRNEIRFSVRIPLFDEEGLPISAYEFSKKCANYLKKNFGIRSQNMTQGLGDAHIIIKNKK